MKKLLLILALTSLSYGTWTSGKHTFGPGGNASKLAYAIDSLGNITAGTACTLSFTATGSITESVGATYTSAATCNGRLVITSNTPPLGVFHGSPRLNISYAGALWLSIYPAGTTGVIEIENLIFNFTGADGATYGRINLSQITTTKFLVHDCKIGRAHV